jgi:hypothetical protein
LIWNQSITDYSHDPTHSSFIFSINNEKILNINHKGYNAIYNHYSYGPTFGAHAFYISDQCNLNNNSYSCNSSFGENISWGCGLLAHGCKFQVEEIEVFQLIIC